MSDVSQPPLDAHYWTLAKLADSQSESVATNQEDTPEGMALRWVGAIELLAVETHLTRKLMERQAQALIDAALNVTSE